MTLESLVAYGPREGGEMEKAHGDREHLVRLVALFAAGTLIFLVARHLLVPREFGDYGHWRPGALADVASRSMVFAGRAACADCHQDKAEKLATSKHAHVGCEACHGPAAKHAAADDPKSAAPRKPAAPQICLVCHSQSLAKPKGFPQVDVKTHYDGACLGCHDPHAPI